jgi:hypothetical protein
MQLDVGFEPPPVREALSNAICCERGGDAFAIGRGARVKRFDLSELVEQGGFVEHEVFDATRLASSAMAVSAGLVARARGSDAVNHWTNYVTRSVANEWNYRHRHARGHATSASTRVARGLDDR